MWETARISVPNRVNWAASLQCNVVGNVSDAAEQRNFLLTWYIKESIPSSQSILIHIS